MKRRLVLFTVLQTFTIPHRICTSDAESLYVTGYESVFFLIKPRFRKFFFQ